MSLTDLLTQTLTVYRATGETRDSIGGITLTETSTEVPGYIWPVTSQEDLVNRNTQIGDWAGVVGPTADVGGWDRVTALGFAFDVIGPVRPIYNARTGVLSHYEFDLRVVI